MGILFERRPKGSCIYDVRFTGPVVVDGNVLYQCKGSVCVFVSYYSSVFFLDAERGDSGSVFPQKAKEDGRVAGEGIKLGEWVVDDYLGPSSQYMSTVASELVLSLAISRGDA